VKYQYLLTCSPYFAKSALHELQRHHPQTSLVQQIIPGYLLIQAPQSHETLVAPWLGRLPIYLHHLFPVESVLPLDGTRHDLVRLKAALRERDPRCIQARIPIQALLYAAHDIERLLGAQSRAYVDALHERVASVFIAQVGGCLQAYIGVSNAAHNLSPYTGGVIPITEMVANRAGYKLIEALTAFDIRLRPRDHALDLGAAPGAWTTILRQRGLRVTAVAPAPLYPWLQRDHHVFHHAITAQEFLPRCRDSFDLIVNDMVVDGQDSARLMVAYAARLRPEGIAIMTLKLREAGRLRVMDHSLRILRQAYKIIRVRQLVYNRKEVTLFLRKKR
jgi:23S rRNA (cytidine2498-2'-O)-methyltransferase